MTARPGASGSGRTGRGRKGPPCGRDAGGRNPAGLRGAWGAHAGTTPPRGRPLQPRARHHPGTGGATGGRPLSALATPFPGPRAEDAGDALAAVALTQWRVEPPAAERRLRSGGHRPLGDRLRRLRRRVADAPGFKEPAREAATPPSGSPRRRRGARPAGTARAWRCLRPTAGGVLSPRSSPSS